MSKQTYIVTWEVEVDAKSPVKAAKKALKVQRDRTSVAVHFTVRESDDPQGLCAVDIDCERLHDYCPRCGNEYAMSEYAGKFYIYCPADGAIEDLRKVTEFDDDHILGYPPNTVGAMIGGAA